MDPTEQSDNPYKTPQANVEAEDSEKRPIRGVILGFCVDIGGTMIGATVFAIAYAAMLGASGVTVEQIERTLSDTSLTSVMGGTTTVIGLLMSLMSGYVCIKVSRGTSVKYSVILATIVLGVGVALGQSSMTLTELVVLSALAFALTVLGGKLALGSPDKNA
jgi:hypothetical protein